MTKSEYKVALLAGVLFIVGFGCGGLDTIPLEQIVTGASAVSETTAAMSESVEGQPSETLKMVSIITEAISAIAFGLLWWRLRRNNQKEK